MIKYLVLATALLIGSTAAQSVCSLRLETFSDDTCSTSKTYPPHYPDGMADFDVKINQCYARPGQSGDASHIKMVYCDPSEFVAFAQFNDEKCKNYASQKVKGFVPGDCTIENTNTWFKISNVTLKGNKFGIGWKEGWGIFLCQTMLFGVCNGY